MTVPLASEAEYSQPLVVLSVLLLPLWLCFYLDLYGAAFGGIPAPVALLLVSAALATAVHLTTPDRGRPGPAYAACLGLVGFASAATWIDAIASELVAILTFAGLLLSIPGSILGLTVLAWGNSVGDLSANMAMARKGLANMAITACFAGPLFNILVGLGVGFLLLDEDGSEAARVVLPDVIVAGLAFILLNNVAMAAWGIRAGGVVSRKYGYGALALYGAYLVVSGVLGSR